MSLIRVGLAETKNFAEGYDAIFGKKPDKQEDVQPVEVPKAAASEPASKPVENPFRKGSGIGC